MLIEDSSLSDIQVEYNIHNQIDPGRDSIASFRTLHPNLAPVGHQTKYQDTPL